MHISTQFFRQQQSQFFSNTFDESYALAQACCVGGREQNLLEHAEDEVMQEGPQARVEGWYRQGGEGGLSVDNSTWRDMAMH